MDDFGFFDWNSGDESAPPPKPRPRASKKLFNGSTRQSPGYEHLTPPNAHMSISTPNHAIQAHDDTLSLPSFLQRYGVRVRQPYEFSGPPVLSEESDEGYVEYKLRLSRKNPFRFQQLVTQLKFRISEGGGQCYYIVGVEDNGHPVGLHPEELATSLDTLEAMAVEVDATTTVVHNPPGTEGRQCAVVMIRKTAPKTTSTLSEVRIAAAGWVDGGKSTLISVLSHGADGKPSLDNGRGSARMAVLRHKHEIESGRTSCISHRIVGYGTAGQILNYSKIAQYTPHELAASASKIVRFSDLGGHQRYSKTSLHGLTSTRPDYTMLCICAAQGLSWVALDHLAVSLALGLPVFIVITKIDTVEERRLQQVQEELVKIADQSFGQISFIESVDDAMDAAEGFHACASGSTSQRVLPVFSVSCVKGTGIAELHTFLNALPPTPTMAMSLPAATAGLTNTDTVSPPNTHFQVDGSMHVAGVGLVLSGVVVSGTVSAGETFYLGPLDNGTFQKVKVFGIHRAQVDVPSVEAGQHATVAIDYLIDSNMCNSSSSSDDSQVLVVEEERVEEGDSSPSGSSSSSDELFDGLEFLKHSWSVGNKESINGNAPSQEEQGEEGNGDGNTSRQSPFVEESCPSPSFDPCGPATGVFTGGYKRQTSQSDLERLGKSWEFVRHLSSPTALDSIVTSTAAAAPANRHQTASPLSPSPPKPEQQSACRFRKGLVLLDSAQEATATDSFQAFVVVLGGRWPKDCTNGTASDSATASASSSPLPSSHNLCLAGDCSDSTASELLPLQRSHSTATATASEISKDSPLQSYQFMCYCGGVRQAVKLDRFLAIRSAGQQDPELRRYGGFIAGAEAARLVLSGDGGESNENESVMHQQQGYYATAEFRFVHRPEWIVPGSKFVVRDRHSGKVAGVGMIVDM